MGNRNLENYLYRSLGKEIQPKRLEQTIKYCTEIMREHVICKEEPRTSFLQYLSDVFRFEGIPILVLQAITLFLVCMTISSIADIPQNIPVFMPLFVLAAMPVLFKSQYYGMSEIEAATRASGAQIMLAKLVLAGSANLVCITIVLFWEISLQSDCSQLGQVVLYCLVPYLVCMTGMLRLVRLKPEESTRAGTAVVLGSCICWAISSRVIPWIYATSAIGFWLIAFVVFGMFFVKEILFIAEMRKEGKMYGIIA